MPSRYGLTQIRSRPDKWVYRDQAAPHRRVWIQYSRTAFTMTPGERCYDVWLCVKRKPKVHVVIGDMLDALAKAAEIIHTPPRG